ncbi:branched-chain amino acid ABC transporter permease [Candidatus Woesearchaeota archaeon]|nr:branched-chain amino acid ABC transporter permease [Candidatus Woesearchaeota archaeon]
MIESYLIHLLIMIGIYLILAVALQLAIGYTGLMNLGHIAFFAIGAYVSTIFTLSGIPFLLAFIFAGIIAMIFGYALAYPVNRLKGDYLALATMAFTFVIWSLLINLKGITKGPLGIANIPSPSIFGFQLISPFHFLILVIIIAVLTYYILHKIVRSPFGKVLEAVRDQELTTKILGKNTLKMKSYAFAISAFFAGLSGSLYAHYITYISPSAFTILELLPILAIVIIGGLGSLRGTALATVILILLPESLRFIGVSASFIGPARQFVFALLLILILIYRPKGLMGRVDID